MAQNETVNECDTLSSIFKKLLTSYECLESSDLATSDAEYQQKVIQCIPEAENAVHKVNLLHLFSDNEEIDEVTTNSLKYILLPALLGYFTMKQTEGDRLEIISKGKAYFKDFMRLCSLYKLTSVKLEPNDEEEEEEKHGNGLELTKSSNSNKNRDPNLLLMANQRQTKIERYKEQKKLISELKDLRTHVEKSHVEEEVERKYYMLLLRHWINTVIDEYENIKFELQILEQKPNLAHSHSQHQQKEPSQKQSFRPFIITKDQLQKKVLGAGYPSLPTLTIEEFYDQKIKEGTLKIPTSKSSQNWAADPKEKSNSVDKEEAEADGKLDNDDPETLAKARSWDDWKDDIRRGDGNRYNMG